MLSARGPRGRPRPRRRSSAGRVPPPRRSGRRDVAGRPARRGDARADDHARAPARSVAGRRGRSRGSMANSSGRSPACRRTAASGSPDGSSGRRTTMNSASSRATRAAKAQARSPRGRPAAGRRRRRPCPGRRRPAVLRPAGATAARGRWRAGRPPARRPPRPCLAGAQALEALLARRRAAGHRDLAAASKQLLARMRRRPAWPRHQEGREAADQRHHRDQRPQPRAPGDAGRGLVRHHRREQALAQRRAGASSASSARSRPLLARSSICRSCALRDSTSFWGDFAILGCIFAARAKRPRARRLGAAAQGGAAR